MMTKVYFIVLSSILLLTSSCIFIPSIKGDGNVTAHTIDIGDYNKIEFYVHSGVFNYSQQPEEAPALTITVDQNIFDLFDFKTEGKTLVIRPKDKNMKKRLHPTEFTITSNSVELKEVSMAGEGDFNVTGKLVSSGKVQLDIAGKGEINLNDSVIADILEFNVAGNSTINALALNTRFLEGKIAGKGTMHLAGKGENAEISIAGNCNVDAFNFELSSISCDMAGKCSLKTWANDHIAASIAGWGNIYYKGDPSIEVDKAGIGRVKKVD